MTDETLKPKPKRRRRIIDGVLLLVVGFVTWWQWPRGDQRFVGTWGDSSLHLGTHYQFRANGTGAEVSEAFEGRTTERLTWRVADKQLVLRTYAPLTSVLDRPSRLTEAILGYERRYSIYSHSPNEIVLSTMVTVQGKRMPLYHTWTRIPE